MQIIAKNIKHAKRKNIRKYAHSTRRFRLKFGIAPICGTLGCLKWGNYTQSYPKYSETTEKNNAFL
jgi:hypothetical protein